MHKRAKNLNEGNQSCLSVRLHYGLALATGSRFLEHTAVSQNCKLVPVLSDAGAVCELAPGGGGDTGVGFVRPHGAGVRLQNAGCRAELDAGRRGRTRHLESPQSLSRDRLHRIRYVFCSCRLVEVGDANSLVLACVTKAN